MSPARFLLRFDDICPTMDWGTWGVVEEHLLRRQARPLLAVVPDNRDPKLQVGPPDPGFWDRVRAWQARGWTIAVHGYQHLYETESAGLLGLHAGSEFAGLSAELQSAKLRQALAVFARESVAPDAWVAPGHSFDATTLEVLSELGMRVVSDGFSILPFTDALGLTWIPQQLWGLRPRPFGVWTACYHPNELTPRELARFGADLERYRNRMTSVAELLKEFKGRRPTAFDDVTSSALRRYVLLRRRAGRLLRRRQRERPTR